DAGRQRSDALPRARARPPEWRRVALDFPLYQGIVDASKPTSIGSRVRGIHSRGSSSRVTEGTPRSLRSLSSDQRNKTKAYVLRRCVHRYGMGWSWRDPQSLTTASPIKTRAVDPL